MSKYLHRLGLFAFAHPWRVVSVWLVLLAVLGFGAFRFMEPTSSSISIPGTQAQQAIDRTQELFPEIGGGSGRIVFHTKDGATIEQSKENIERVVEKIRTVEGVEQVVSPFVSPLFISKSGTIGYAQVQLSGQVGSIKESTTNEIESIVASANNTTLQVEVGGDVVQRAPGEIIGVGEIVGVVVALMVLVITLGSLIAGGMPIMSALLAVGVSMAGLFSLSKVLDINSTTPVLAVMLGLAVGIDYALFIINKYRSLVLSGYGYKDAAARALATAGNAVVFAAFTVIIALAALSVVNIPFMTIMGFVGASSIAISALVAITLIPALLGLAGSRIFSKKQRKIVDQATKTSKKKSLAVNTRSVWYKWGKAVIARPIPILLASILLIGTIALPARELQLGLPTDQYAAPDSTERKAYDLLTEGFGKGFNGPLIMLVEGLPKVSDTEKNAIRQQGLQQLEAQATAETMKQQQLFAQKESQATTLEAQQLLQQEIAEAQRIGIQKRTAAVEQIERAAEENAKFVQLKKVSDAVSKLTNVQVATPASATNDGTSGLIQVIPRSAPSDKPTSDLIATLRDDDTRQQLNLGTSTNVSITGSAALQDDINDKLAAALPVYLAVVVGLSLVLLLIAFRSVLIPIKATLGFLLSVAAMFGAMVAVFQWGWFGITDAPGPLVSFIPIIASGILFGLAMDYEFFLVSGMHEAYEHSKDPKKSILTGFGAGSKVVTAAAIIMISVFGGFVTNHEAVIQSIGFGLAVGILIDAFIVRMTIVPAVMSLMGDAAWWLPRWLDRRLPRISIEGEATDQKTKR